jgi:hypothetical protein
MPPPTIQRSRIYLGILLGVILSGALVATLYVRHAHRVSQSPVVEPALDIFSGQPQLQQTVAKAGILDELPAGAPVIAYANLAELQKWQAPLATLLGIDSSSPLEDQEYRKFVRETGFDYSRDLDRVAISFWPANFGIQAGSIPVQNRTFAIAEGRFNEGKIKAYALKVGHARMRGKQQQFYEVPGNPPVAFEFRSPTELAFASGEDASAMLAAANSENAEKKDLALQSEIDRVAAAPLFAIIRGEKLPASFYLSLQSYPQIEHLARDVLTLVAAGQPAGSTLRIALDAENASRTDALEIATLLEISRMGISVGMSDPKAQPQMTGQQGSVIEALMKELKITHEAREVSIRLGITPDMLNAAKNDSTSAPASVSQARR